MKKCPYCAEEIQDEAIVCRYCGRDLKIAKTPAQSNNAGIPKENKSVSHLLFSAEGRISRSTYWYYQIAMFGLSFVAAFADGYFGTNDSSSGDGWIFIIFELFLLITAINVYIKRCHDLNWSGWYILLAIVPLANIYIGINWAFVKGTVGLNRYGPDPTQ